MPKAPPSSLSSRKKFKSSSSGGSGSSNSASLAHTASLAQELREEQLRNKFGNVSAPGKRVKQKKRKLDAAAQDDQGADGEAAPGRITSSHKFGSSDAAAKKRFIDPKLSRNILRLAQEQQEEMDAEEAADDDAEALEIGARTLRHQDEPLGSTSKRRGFGKSMDFDDDDSHLDQNDAGPEDDGELDEKEALSGDEDFEEDYEELEIDPEDRRLMEQMEASAGASSSKPGIVRFGGEHADLERALPADEEDDAVGAEGGGRSLADIIMAKLEEAESKQSSGNGFPLSGAPHERPMPPGINPKVVEVYTKVGELLSRYKSGPLPKALKIVPSLPAWETILYITNPATWTPHATLAATRIFASNLKSAQTQKFFELVLLDKVRDEIADRGKLSVQMYDALKKGLYKPAAFFKGLLFPLCESGTVTLKEAAIISSVLAKVSVPVLHSGAALLHLASMPYKGPTSLFIRVLLDKKYALPYKVVDALVFHFLKFADPSKGVEMEKINGVSTGERRMPVLWHQSLLVFAQRYKQDLTPDQKTALLDLLRVQKHDGIGPEVRRELTTGEARGEMLEEPIGYGDADLGSDYDDAMSV